MRALHNWSLQSLILGFCGSLQLDSLRSEYTVHTGDVYVHKMYHLVTLEASLPSQLSISGVLALIAGIEHTHVFLHPNGETEESVSTFCTKAQTALCCKPDGGTRHGYMIKMCKQHDKQ